jgi:hypothetical protein
VKPLYKHDCNACQYLGVSDKDADLYYCPGLMGGSLVSRYSNKPSEYQSVKFDIILNHIQDLDIQEAAKRQVKAWSSKPYSKGLDVSGNVIGGE